MNTNKKILFKDMAQEDGLAIAQMIMNSDMSDRIKVLALECFFTNRWTIEDITDLVNNY